jgi:amidase
MDEYINQSALEQARSIHRGDVSSVELTRFYFDRIKQYNPDLQAFVRITEKRALLAATRADRRRSHSRGANLPPFHGVPFAIKDLVPTFGVPTHLGSKAYRYFVPPFSGAVVSRFRKAGFIVLGKLATSEFGIMPVTEPDIRAPTRNPWNRLHTSGGSSGGSSAAVAAGLLPAAHASDGGGSIRIPASFTHLYGLKPSLARTGNFHGPVNRLGLATMGSLTHTVEDAAIIMDALSLPGQPSCAAAMETKPSSLLIYVCTESPVGDVDPEVKEAVHQTARVLEKLGHRVVERPTIEASISEFLPVWAYMVARVPSVSEKVLQPISRWLREIGRKVKYEEAHSLQKAFCNKIDSFFGDADLVLTPTVGVTAPQVGAFNLPDPEKAFYDAAFLGSFTIMANLMKAPSANIPFGLSENGLPIGVQIGGRPGDDPLVVTLSRQLEAEMPWRQRRAPGFGDP